MEMNKELIEKAKAAKNPAELIELGRLNGLELSEKTAEETFAMLHQTGELTDEEMNNVAGGACHGSWGLLHICQFCNAICVVGRAEHATCDYCHCQMF